MNTVRHAVTCGLCFVAWACTPEPHADATGHGAPHSTSSERREGARTSDPAIVLPLETPFTSLDPAEANDAVSRRIVDAISDALFEVRLIDGHTEVHPALAAALPERAETPAAILGRAPHAVSVRITLRAGAAAPRYPDDPCFADGRGRAVRASDVRASLLRHADPRAPRAYGLLAGRIVGFDAYAAAHLDPARAGELDALADTVAIEADDDTHAVTLHLTRAQPELAALLAVPQLAILPPECVTYWDARGDLGFGGHPVGAGPFAVEHARTEPLRSVTLWRRDDSGASPPSSSSTVTLRHFQSNATALEAFRRGDLAILAPAGAEFQRAVVVAPDGDAHPSASMPRGTRIERSPLASTTMLVFVRDDAVIGRSDDPVIDAQHLALRRAIALAFDAPRYHSVVRDGVRARVATSLVPPVLDPAHDAPAADAADLRPRHAYAPPAPDLEAARRLLREAGVGPTRLRYLTTTDELARREAELLQTALAPLGLEVEVVADDRYLERLLDTSAPVDAQLFAVRFDADYADPENVLQQFTCQGTLARLARGCDPAWDARFEAWRADVTSHTPDGGGSAARAASTLAALERALGDAAWVRPIDHPDAFVLVAPWLDGFTRDPLTGVRLEHLRRRRPADP
jgi:ABC-type transport system substrate-binding protein